EHGCGKPGCTVGCDCDRYIEVWNNVFSQFVNDGENHYTEMKNKNIDTGMGLERLACVCQNVNSLFDVDTVMNITNKVSEITGAHYEESHETDVSLRVITDHIRSATFMIADGVLPSNEGRGYVLRRLLRRAARHGKLLGVDRPFLYEVCDTVIHENEGHYPELRERQAYITKVIRVEEENFARTLDGGLKIFRDMLEEHKTKGETVFSGADAFKLYDTYGFPIDLTVEMVAEQGMSVDQDAFKSLMQEQKERARRAREALGDLGWAGIEFGKDMPETQFVGYEAANLTGCPAKILAIVAEEELRDEVMAGSEAILVLDQTPFYAEMGGQVADHGVITCGGARFEVTDVQKNKGGKFMHYGKLTEGSLKVNDAVTCSVDLERRKAIARAHSATHLLDAALRKVLGAHVQQSGSLVEPDRLRFDFTHFSAMTPEELTEVERLVNEAILEGYEVRTDILPIEEAKQRGAIALFGEKYGDTVRVVDMGNGKSVEFCGGTHLDNTAKTGTFRIKSEASIASGVRRIEATVGKLTLEDINRSREMIFRVSELMKVKPSELDRRIEQQIDEVKSLRHTVESFQDKEAMGEANRFLMGSKEVGGLRVLTATIPDAGADRLRKMGDFLRDKAPNGVAVLSTVNGGKITFLAVCGKEAVAKGIKAGDIIKSVTAICGGKGGGKPDSAMGGGTDVLKLDDALASVDDFVHSKLGL
ncbi:MAG: alanine--tRNA ligase, partial [Clostridiales bacterium]|nr:alanine--tRNA ligase [Clostridiales bacterium]